MSRPQGPSAKDLLLLLWWVCGIAGIIAFNRYVLPHQAVYRHHPVLFSMASVVAGSVLIFGVTVLATARGSSRSERAKILGVVALGVVGYSVVLLAIMAAEAWLVRWLVPRGSRKPVALTLFGLTALAPMLAPWLLDWRSRRRRAREIDAVAAYFSAPRPRPTVEQRLQTALAQHLARAFTGWWRGLGVVCPGCDGRALSTDLSNEHRVYAPGPSIYHFTAVTIRIHCPDCGWGLCFPHTDDPPQQRESAPTLAERQRPVRLWQVSKGGAVVGTVITGPRPMTQPSPGVGPDGLASLRLAEALASAVAELDLSAAGAGAEPLIARALGGHLALYGVTIGPVA